MRQVDRGHWNSHEKEYFYVKRAEALHSPVVEMVTTNTKVEIHKIVE